MVSLATLKVRIAALGPSLRHNPKVFWFFFSKKNYFLAADAWIATPQGRLAITR
jgi:hypothetical protein